MADNRNSSSDTIEAPMRGKKIARYLDSGSLALFARQITEMLGNVLSVAIHDVAGQLVWAGPEPGATEDWSVDPFLGDRVPGPGFCKPLSNKNLVYVFYLESANSNLSMGTVTIQIDPTNPPSFELVHAETQPIIACIARQLEINSELSSVRRMTEEGKRGLRLLMKMDEMDTTAGPQEILRSVLDLAATHFKVDLVAAVLPQLGIQETSPRQLLEDEATSKAVMTTLGSLIAAAKVHRKVLLSDANITTKFEFGLTDRQPKVLCSPIMSARDEVIGIFVLMGSAGYSKEQVRLTRAICAKVRQLTRTADQLNSAHYSRHGLLHYISNILQRDPEQSHALIYVDIDKLHVVNDNYGHIAGDKVIERVSEVIGELANKEDAVSHLSGDRFGLFLRGCDESSAAEKADLILEALAHHPVDFESVPIDVSASIGIVMIPEVATNASAALNTAEIAARSAKGRGGSRIVVFRDVDASVAQRRSDLDHVNLLQYALIQNRFVLYAQPIVPLIAEDSPERYEILIRMYDDDGNTLAPARFMSSAERYQMMSAIDRWVIKNTLGKLSAADNLLEVNLAKFSINVSAQSLIDDDFVDFIEAQIASSGISPDSLCFEITETAVVRNLERALRFIRRLRKLGCSLALDDFGTGYCSFAYLKDLPVHYVKVDGVFVRDVLENPLSEAIISSMTEIARVMKAATVAEHVENDLVMQQMQKFGLDFAQGFAIGRPKPLDQVLESLGQPTLLDTTQVIDDDKEVSSS